MFDLDKEIVLIPSLSNFFISSKPIPELVPVINAVFIKIYTNIVTGFSMYPFRV